MLNERVLDAFYCAPSLRGRRLPPGAGLDLQRSDDHTDVIGVMDGHERLAHRVSHLIPVRSKGEDRLIPQDELDGRLRQAAIAVAFWLIDDFASSRRRAFVAR